MADMKRFRDNQCKLFASIRQKLQLPNAHDPRLNEQLDYSDFPEDIANALGIRNKPDARDNPSFVNELHEMLQIPDLTLEEATIYHQTRWKFNYAVNFEHEFAHLILALAGIEHYQRNMDMENFAAGPLGDFIMHRQHYPKKKYHPAIEPDLSEKTAKQLYMEFNKWKFSDQESDLKIKGEFFDKVHLFLDVVMKLDTAQVNLRSMPFRDFVKAVGMEEKLPPLLTAGAADKNLSHIPSIEHKKKL